MLTRSEEKFIISLHSKKGRRESGQCLVEGEKFVETAKDFVVRTFTPEESDRFAHLVTTETPQDIAAIATIPTHDLASVVSKKTVVVLDGIQDPGNVGALFRLARAFDAGLILIESADPTNSKVIRSSAGEMFHVPWVEVARTEAVEVLQSTSLPVVRLEKTEAAQPVTTMSQDERLLIVAGSEGRGIQLDLAAPSVFIPHAGAVDSLNVTHAVAIALFLRQ